MDGIINVKCLVYFQASNTVHRIIYHMECIKGFCMLNTTLDHLANFPKVLPRKALS